MKNRGQIDMFGLVIIVILIVVIALFSLFFISRDTNERDVYYSLRAYNFANALSRASVENTNSESLILSCCSGISGSCETFLDFVEGEFDKLGFADGVSKKMVKVELDCYAGFKGSRGECVEGIASESIILQSGDLIRVILCRN